MAATCLRVLIFEERWAVVEAALRCADALLADDFRAWMAYMLHAILPSLQRPQRGRLLQALLWSDAADWTGCAADVVDPAGICDAHSRMCALGLLLP